MKNLAEITAHLQALQSKSPPVFEVWRPEHNVVHFAVLDSQQVSEKLEQLLIANQWHLCLVVPSRQRDRGDTATRTSSETVSELTGRGAVPSQGLEENADKIYFVLDPPSWYAVGGEERAKERDKEREEEQAEEGRSSAEPSSTAAQGETDAFLVLEWVILEDGPTGTDIPDAAAQPAAAPSAEQPTDGPLATRSGGGDCCNDPPFQEGVANDLRISPSPNEVSQTTHGSPPFLRGAGGGSPMASTSSEDIEAPSSSPTDTAFSSLGQRGVHRDPDWLGIFSPKVRDVLRPYGTEVAAYFGSKPRPTSPDFPTMEKNSDETPCFSRAIVGPVHAAIIQPGRFTIDLIGEEIARVQIDLGYTSKGVEPSLERLTIQEAGDWKKALSISAATAGDACVAHNIALCRAVEAFALEGLNAQLKLCERAHWLRAILLELERISNHLNDVAALAHDIGFDRPANQICLLREELREHLRGWTGSRMLRGCIALGGVPPGPAEKLETAWKEGIPVALLTLLVHFLKVARTLWENAGTRIRMKDVARLGSEAQADRSKDGAADLAQLKKDSREAAASLGATGMVARSAGSFRDLRLDHPWGPYGEPTLQQIIRASLELSPLPEAITGPFLKRLALVEVETRQSTLRTLWGKAIRPPSAGTSLTLPSEPAPPLAEVFSFFGSAYTGDVLSRLALRLNETIASTLLLDYMGRLLPEPSSTTASEEQLLAAARSAPPFSFRMGHVEGWRGATHWWVMKGKDADWMRFKIRDPSRVGWPVLEYLLCHARPRVALADFPLVNKSFNLSYTGNDL